MPPAMRVKQSTHLTLRDKLSRLTLQEAEKLLGPQGPRLLAKGGMIEIDLVNDVALTDEYFRVAFPNADVGRRPLVVTVSLHDADR